METAQNASRGGIDNMAIIRGLILAFLLSACATGQGPDVLRQHDSITIYRDEGGKVGQYFTDVMNEQNTTRQVRIEGECASACTAWLRLKDRVCAGPNARLGFHRFSGIGDDYAFSAYRALYLPPDFRDWVDSHVTGSEIKWMEHDEILQHLKACT
jgi:hypothetical protein